MIEPTQAADVVHVSIARLPHGEDMALPDYQSESAAGMDLHAAVPVDEPVVVMPGTIALIPTGFAIALPVGYEAQIRPRSGLAVKHGITLINSPGTIDADYRGEIKVPIVNHGSQAFGITRDMRIAQMVIKPVPRTVWREVADLDATQRGEGGFGHTGR